MRLCFNLDKKVSVVIVIYMSIKLKILKQKVNIIKYFYLWEKGSEICSKQVTSLYRYFTVKTGWASFIELRFCKEKDSLRHNDFCLTLNRNY